MGGQTGEEVVVVYEPAAYVAALSRILQMLEEPSPIGAIVSELTESVRSVFDLAGAAVLLPDDGELTVAAASAPVQGLERAQQRSQRGPACEAQRRGAVVVAADLTQARGRWPEFAAAAQRMGIVATAAVPLRWDRQTIGWVDLHSATPRPWCPGDLAAATVLARVVAGHLATDATLRKRQQLTEQLENALASRVVIEQAKGIIAAEGAVTVDEAFDRLRRHARRHRTSVQEVAAAVVEGHLHLTPASPPRAPD